MLSLILPVVLGLIAPPPELSKFLNAPDSSYGFSIEKTQGQVTTIEMTSQLWHGVTWKHQILYSLPDARNHRGVAILYITGDGPRPGDYVDINLMSHSTGMPIAMLFDEPNQPLWGLKEDDLIAYTFKNYLDSGDATWPLLFPMTKAAIRAMDTIVEATKKSDNPITSFVVTGASKRGWTTWMTAASGDRRIKGIAPMVYDNLNIPAQMPHQLESWGAYSEMIEAYTKLGLQSQLGNDKGKKLGEIVDPYSYRDKFRVPILVVKGSNDPYWAADATDLYFKGLKPPHWLFTVPNAGHTLNGGFLAAQSIGAFARSIAGEFKMPELNPDLKVEVHNQDRFVTYHFKNTEGAIRIRPYVALSDTTDFRKSKYIEPTSEEVKADQISFTIPANRCAAFFLEAEYRTPDGREFGLSTPTQVLKTIGK
jgi:PhoPQ-activated pathogenicity-related protein